MRTFRIRFYKNHPNDLVSVLFPLQAQLNGTQCPVKYVTASVSALKTSLFQSDFIPLLFPHLLQFLRQFVITSCVS